MNETKQLSLSITKTINAPVEKVFDAWLDPETLSRFMLPKAGMPCPAVKLDPSVGGRFQIDMDVGEKIIPHEGEYLEIERPNRLCFTWVSPFSAPGSTVTIDFQSSGEGVTDITLSHVRHLSEESRDSHHGGWTNILDQEAEVI
ncbi:MAG: SRPBCC family protein [bacterium]